MENDENSEKSPTIQRIEAALADLPGVAEALARYLEDLVRFKKAAEDVVDAVTEQEIWIPQLSSFPPTAGNA